MDLTYKLLSPADAQQAAAAAKRRRSSAGLGASALLASALLGTSAAQAADEAATTVAQASVPAAQNGGTRSAAEIQAEIELLKKQIEDKEKELSAAGAPSQASAPEPEEEFAADETTLDTVVVRARNRLEPLKDVPLSVSVVTGKELERLNATDIKAVLQRAGNVAWNQGNQRTSSLSIRGIGKIGQTEAQDPSVGVILDGVNFAYNALTSSYDFTDVESIEVTRGPQGTLLGKNSSVGIINIRTRRPSFTPDASYSVGFGDNDMLQGWVAGGGPVVDNLLAWRGTLSVSKAQGDVRNAYNRDNTYTNRDRATGRVQLLLTPTKDLNIRVSGEKSPRAGEATNGRTINLKTPKYSNGTSIALSNEARLARPWFTQQSSYTVEGNYLYGGGQNQVNNDSARPLVTGSNGLSGEVNWHVGNFDVTSITAYRDYHFNAVNDEGTPFDVQRNSGGFINDYKQKSQELRVSSQVGDLVDYQTGLYFLKVDNRALYQRVWGDDAGAWFATASQYTALDADGNGRYLMRNSLAGLSMAFNSPAGLQDINNKSSAVFAQANWHITKPLTVTTGVRFTREERNNTGSTFIRDNGSGAELNPDVVNGVSLGGFTSDNNGVLAASNSAQQLALADSVALKYFKLASYSLLSVEQKKQVAAAKALRKSQIGVVFNPTQAEAFEKTQPSFVLSPTYKINEQLTAYVSWQYGEKPGISQLVNGISESVKEEKTSDYEIGLKTLLLDNTLTFNTTVYNTEIKNYQQSVRLVDEYTTALNKLPGGTNETAYTSATGNVPKVRAQGVEVDAVYAGIQNLTLRFSGAYNDVQYRKFPNSAQPAENGYTTPTAAPAFRDVSGENLAGAPKMSANLGIDYHIPVLSTLDLHTSENIVYSSRFNSDVALSSYSWIQSSTTVDAAIGLGRRDRRYDVNLIVKNAFDDDTPLSRTWNNYSPGFGRTFFLQFTGNL